MINQMVRAPARTRNTLVGRFGLPKDKNFRARLNFQRLNMFPEDLGKLFLRNAAKTAIGADAEIGQIFSRRSDAFTKSGHIMDGAQIDARSIYVQIGQRCEIAVGGGIKNRNMDPIDAPA